MYKLVVFEYDPSYLEKEAVTFEKELGWLEDSKIRPVFICDLPGFDERVAGHLEGFATAYRFNSGVLRRRDR